MTRRHPYSATEAAKSLLWAFNYDHANDNQALTCDWFNIRSQLLLQWDRLTKDELDTVGPNRHGLAILVQRKYGVSARLIENYLANLERTLPLNGGSSVH